MKTIIGTILMAALLILFSIVSISTDREIMETFIVKYSYDAPEALTATHQLFDHFQGQAEMPEEFGEKEASHMQDVKDVLQRMKWAFLIVFLLLAVIMPFTDSNKVFIYGGAITLALTLIVAAIPFNALFTIMHQVFFPQGNWTFPASSILMYYYPGRFFAAYGTALMAVTVLVSFLSMLIGFVLKKG